MRLRSITSTEETVLKRKVIKAEDHIFTDFEIEGKKGLRVSVMYDPKQKNYGILVYEVVKEKQKTVFFKTVKGGEEL